MRSWRWRRIRGPWQSFVPQGTALVVLPPLLVHGAGVHDETHHDLDDNEEGHGMGNGGTVNKMLKAGRAYLQSYPGGIDDYQLKQVMACAAPGHTALHQQEAMLQLRAEQAPRGQKRAAK